MPIVWRTQAADRLSILMNQLTLKLLTLAALIYTVSSHAAGASDKPSANFEIIGRHRLESVTMAADNQLRALNMSRKVTAPKGFNLEILRVKATASWGNKADDTLYADINLSYTSKGGAMECPPCAYLNDRGVFVSGSSFKIRVSHPGGEDSTSSSAIGDYVFIVPQHAKELSMKVTESGSQKEHKLSTPSPTPVDEELTPTKIATKIMSSEQVDSLELKQLISYTPRIELKHELGSTSGSILIVKAKSSPETNIPQSIKRLVLTPGDFSIKLPNGQLIRAFGTLIHGQLESASYPTNVIRKSDGSWPDMSEDTLLFLAPDKVGSFELIYQPR